jgi:hypothetical protein
LNIKLHPDLKTIFKYSSQPIASQGGMLAPVPRWRIQEAKVPETGFGFHSQEIRWLEYSDPSGIRSLEPGIFLQIKNCRPPGQFPDFSSDG